MYRPGAFVASALLVTLAGQAGKAAENNFFSDSGKSSAPASAGLKPANGQTSPSLAELGAADNAVVESWKRLPFMTRNVMFVSRKAEAYGGYEKRVSSVFVPGEKLITYAEPIGYNWEAANAGTFRFGVTTDFEILTADGKVLGGQRAFQSIDLTTHYQNRELFLSLTMTIDGFKPGDYVLAYDIHDNFGGRTTRTEQPFTIKTP